MAHHNHPGVHHHHSHDHSHDHSHHHHHHAPPTGKIFVIGISLNLLFVAMEFFYGLKVNSLALIADAGHNLSDVAGLLLAWAAMAISLKSPTLKQSYGFKKASILAALGNSLFLLIAMGTLIWEAADRFRSPTMAEGMTMIVVAGIGIFVNGFTALMFAKSRHQDLNMKAAYFHMLTDAFVSFGVVVAGLLTLKFQWLWLDPVISLLIAFVIILGTWKIFRQSLNLAFDGVPDNIDVNEVKNFLKSKTGVQEVYDLHIWALGTTEVAMTAHLHLPKGSPGDQFLKQVSEELKLKFHIQHSTLQIIQDPSVNNYCN
jgi:cobalt-zinc-cadmium efflux system protein